jgi:cytochrome c553
MKFLFAMVCLQFALSSPLLSYAADLKAGEKAAQNCVMCHGQYGLSSMAGTPSIAGQPEVYLSSQLKQFRDGTRQNAVMNQIAKTLSDADINNVSAWFAQFETELKKR